MSFLPKLDRFAVCLSVVLFVTTVAIYSPVITHSFLYFDDDAYVRNNSFVQHGLSAESIVWAFTTFHAANWHPLTWLSHMLDWQIYDSSAGGHHLTSLLWHAANAVLLFLVLRRVTGASWRPALVAGLFALHPLHVESAAWVAERKDVLSTFFGILTLGAYARYAERPSLGRYLLVFLAFAISLLAKPMLVTLPFVLLLLDYWPLGRVPPHPDPLPPGGRERRRWRLELAMVVEKVPLMALSALSCVVSVFAQRMGDTVTSVDRLSWGARVANALVAYVVYLRRVIWPNDLAILYPHPGEDYAVRDAVAAGGFLTVVTVLAWGMRRGYPAVLVGWLWYLGTLVPVIGLVQVGPQALADRYTYVPLIGVFIGVAWMLPSFASVPSWARAALILGSVGVLTACSLATVFQLRHWRDDAAVWQRTLGVTKNNPVGHFHWGTTLYRHGDVDHAEEQFALAINLSPGYGQALNNLGTIFLRQGRTSEAVDLHSRAVAVEPLNASFQNGLGLARLRQGYAEKASQCFQQAVELAPEVAEHRFNLASAKEELGDQSGAAVARQKGLRLDPSWPNRADRMAYELLAAENPKVHCPEEALLRARQACQATEGRNPEMLDMLASAYAAAGSMIEALATAKRAVEAARVLGRPDLFQTMEARLRAYEAAMSGTEER